MLNGSWLRSKKELGKGRATNCAKWWRNQVGYYSPGTTCGLIKRGIGSWRKVGDETGCRMRPVRKEP